MTHKDIYTKFMIEYDKANVASSYPSLTEYEIATILDKAYNALIAQKFTGNNPRRSSFESDNKSISDLQPLIKTDVCTGSLDSANSFSVNLPDGFLYYISSCIEHTISEESKPMDKLTTRIVNVKLVDHSTANKFLVSQTNLPWVKTPVCYIEGNKITVIYDPMMQDLETDVYVTFIKKPNTFVKENLTGKYTCFDFDKDLNKNEDGIVIVPKEYRFECNDTVAEELISLAVTFALENVESQRLNTKLNMRGLEA